MRQAGPGGGTPTSRKRGREMRQNLGRLLRRSRVGFEEKGACSTGSPSPREEAAAKMGAGRLPGPWSRTQKGIPGQRLQGQSGTGGGWAPEPASAEWTTPRAKGAGAGRGAVFLGTLSAPSPRADVPILSAAPSPSHPSGP